MARSFFLTCSLLALYSHAGCRALRRQEIMFALRTPPIGSRLTKIYWRSSRRYWLQRTRAVLPPPLGGAVRFGSRCGGISRSGFQVPGSCIPRYLFSRAIRFDYVLVHRIPSWFCANEFDWAGPSDCLAYLEIAISRPRRIIFLTTEKSQLCVFSRPMPSHIREQDDSSSLFSFIHRKG
jgi:hypothetical protein